MTIELYSHWISTKCTMIHLLGYNIGAELDIRDICVFPLEENMKDRLKANVNIRTMERGNSGFRLPILVIDDKKVINDTKDILKYLVGKYCEDDLLYPAERRDDIDTQMSFVLDSLNGLVADIYYDAVVQRESPKLEIFEKLNGAMGEVEEILKENEFICGANLTIADFCLSVVTSTLEAVNHDLSNFPRSTAYLHKCKELIRGWEEVGEVRAVKYGQWYRVAEKAVESGGCPYFPKPRDTVNITLTYSTDVELYTHSLLPKGIMIQLLARTLELKLIIKKTDLCYKEENVESRKESDKNWKSMSKHLYFSDDEGVDAPPMLVDKGKVVVETGNILKYMVEMHGSEEQREQLYPFDLELSNLVEERLSSDLDTLDTLVLEAYIQNFKDVSTKQETDEQKVTSIKEILGNLEEILQQNDFIAGNNLTIADYAFAVTLSVLAAVDPNIFCDFERVTFYLKNCKETIQDWDDVGQSGVDLLGEWYRDCLQWTENGDCPYYKG